MKILNHCFRKAEEYLGVEIVRQECPFYVLPSSHTKSEKPTFISISSSSQNSKKETQKTFLFLPTVIGRVPLVYFPTQFSRNGVLLLRWLICSFGEKRKKIGAFFRVKKIWHGTVHEGKWEEQTDIFSPKQKVVKRTLPNISHQCYLIVGASNCKLAKQILLLNPSTVL